MRSKCNCNSITRWDFILGGESQFCNVHPVPTALFIQVLGRRTRVHRKPSGCSKRYMASKVLGPISRR